ncbi:hypothetical protein Tdes44962_MAKER07107 [Teratosphaeria destructans]|uniref:Uncharacterized protein n=1 Tax=Teratosphaeria destructans TaxID=418781 RepID=A0A9W7SZY2_9PEZI|nr:hypothetical protein Tdes44962_MAKER07107 [Teratosphaeria destructans]
MPLVDAFPAWAVCGLSGADRRLMPIQTYMCNPDLCISCREQIRADQEHERGCMPGSPSDEGCRAEAVRSQGRTHAVMQMAEAAGDVEIDPLLSLLDG